MQDSPFHAGEQEAQTRMGVREMIEPWARQVIRPNLPTQHRTFFAGLAYVFVGARDHAGRPWATLLSGAPGFLSSPVDTHLKVATTLHPNDALSGHLHRGADVGLLGIELHTRRRNRANGRVQAIDHSGLDITVRQSFGNCPQYIRPRTWAHRSESAAPVVPDEDRLERTAMRADTPQLPTLDATLTKLINGADTFFIASGHRDKASDLPSNGMDVSHRGGAPGFVRALSSSTLEFADYAGNHHYNTIGNLLADDRVGLLFVDFERSELLQITGRATIDWDSPARLDYPGAARLVRVEIDAVVRLRDALNVQFAAAGDALRSLRLVARERQTPEVVSFTLAARDGGALPKAAAGQHLSFDLSVEGQSYLRSYSLAGDPAEPTYRISVKSIPGGRVSNLLHTGLSVGEIVNAYPPGGAFVLHPSTRPLVLVGAGIGITPLLSMLHEALRAGRTQILCAHGARSEALHPHRDELLALRRAHPSLQLLFSYTQDDAASMQNRDAANMQQGRLKATQIVTPDAQYYLCGPLSFMTDMRDQLINAGVAVDDVHTEDFGVNVS